MSTILKALRRLEEDSSIDASTSTPSSGSSDSLPATNPHATDELRNRILAEESAAEASGVDRLDPTNSKKRVQIITAIAGATVVTALIVGLVLGLNSSPPDDAVEVVAVVSPVQSPSASRLPNPLAVPIEQRVPAAAHYEDRFAVGTGIGIGIGIAAIPVIPSDNSPANQAYPMNPNSPGPVRTAPSSAPARLPTRLTTKSETPASPEVMAASAVASIAAAVEAESLSAGSVSSGEGASRPPTNPSVTKARVRPTPTRAERQVREVPAAVSAAEPPAKPVMAAPIKATRKASPEMQPKSSAESTAKPATAVVEEHKGRAIPDITVLRTAWHPSPDRRSAKIRLLDTQETLSLKEGDAVGSLVVQEISPSAVIFRSGEIEIRLRVGQPPPGG